MPQAASILPRSVARWYDPFLWVIITITMFMCLRDTSLTNMQVTWAIIAAVTFTMLGFEFARACKSWGPIPESDLKDLLTRAAIKWLGVMLVVTGSLFLWWLIPLYRGPRYETINTAAALFVPLFAAALVPYLLFTEWRLGHHRDYAWNIGLIPLCRWHEINWRLVRDGALSMLIRTIFLPFNFCYVAQNIGAWRVKAWDVMLQSPPTPESHAAIMLALYAVLIVTIIPGYIFSLRLFNTHTRTIDRSWFGWMITLVCYPPLLSGVFTGWFGYNYFRFEEPFMKPWIFLLQDHAMLLYAVGIGIILSEMVHLWGEAIIGIRSSNLTHRGIITNGPFRYLRHPVYISKCVGWTLIFMPFLMGGSLFECIRLGLLLMCVWTIYYLRGIAEERMLSVDADYVTYALWVDKHGWMAWTGRLIPAFTFAWRHAHWHSKP